jgi:non-specific serine/threonine protein kinase
VAGGAAPDAPAFGALLRRHRLTAGLTHEALAERAGVSARAISDLERGLSRAPRPDTVALLATALRLPPDERAALAAAARPRPVGRGGAGPARHNLPVPLTSFVGREAELAALTRLLGDRRPDARPETPPAGPRLVTLTGVGGGGKTRLALEAAARLVPAYPGGAWLVDLAPLADEALVPQAALGALGLREMSARPALDTLTDALRPRALLLVLDNCGHLVGACARLVDALLRACPGLRVLATSRELLGVAGEVAWRVPSLSVPPADDGPGPQDVAAPAPGAGLGVVAAVGRSEAGRLFVERARLAQPAFAVGPGNAPLVAQLCRRLDGIPLALELAAARLRGLTLEQLVARLDDRFRLLAGGGRTALRRQQTLRATVDWSYALLSEPERALLRRLSVFAGGWTLEAAEAVGADLPDVLGLLLQLVDKSLVLVDGGDAGAGGAAAGGRARYRLLETLRQYAGERLLDAGETAAARDRHRDHFLAWAEHAATHVSAREQLVWLARLEAEHDNLRAALDWCRGDGSDRELRLAAALAHFWLLRGYSDEARRLHDVLARGDPRPSRARAVALDWLGFLDVLHAAYDRALPLFEQAAAAAREIGDGPALACALRHLAMFRVSVSGGFGGRPAVQERALLEEALAAARAAGERRETGYVLSLLGLLAFAQGDRSAGTRMLAEALHLLRQVGDRDALCSSLNVAGSLALAQGDRAAARALFEEALAAAREMNLGLSVLLGLTRLGHTAREDGDLVAARSRYLEALAVARGRGDPGPITGVLRALGGWCVAAGHPEQAARLFGAEAAARAGAPIQLLPAAQADRYPDDLAAARAALGATPFESAWAAGAAMPLDVAVAGALRAAADEPPVAPRGDRAEAD